jgi:hypothetical protein
MILQDCNQHGVDEEIAKATAYAIWNTSSKR